MVRLLKIRIFVIYIVEKILKADGSVPVNGHVWSFLHERNQLKLMLNSTIQSTPRGRCSKWKDGGGERGGGEGGEKAIAPRPSRFPISLASPYPLNASYAG